MLLRPKQPGKYWHLGYAGVDQLFRFDARLLPLCVTPMPLTRASFVR